MIQSSGLLSDSTVLDETWALTRASNKTLYAFALLWTSYSLSFGDSDSGHNIAHQPPLFMRFSRQEYWSGLPCPSPGDFPDPWIEPASLMFSSLAGGFFTISATWEAHDLLKLVSEKH